MNSSERILVAILRVIGGAAVLAIVPVFMPHAWMDKCHHLLGLGALPETPVIVYLTRSLSALYVFHGGTLLVVAADVRRYPTMVAYFGWAFLGFGLVATWIDIHAGVPWFWIAAEGPASILVGLAILVLKRRVAFA
jgi:hypothetical protein